MVIDVITYHNEEDLFDLRYNALFPYVDEFIVVESISTFGGILKELNFSKIKDKYTKVKYYVNEENYTPEEIEQARLSPNTAGGVIRWMHEFLQKESIQKAITHLNDEDIVFIGDVDELWDIKALNDYSELRKLKLRVYVYYLNLLSNELFYGPIQAKYKDVKGKCLNHLRNKTPENITEDYYGWHFTNQGGLDAVKLKIFDQYNPETFGNETYYNLENRFGREDYIGRKFRFEVDESNWPQYLKDNRQKYFNLLK